MAKNVIIGACLPFAVKDKETGNSVKMCRIYVVRQAMDVFGQKAEEIVLHGAGYKKIEAFENDVSQLIGLECETDYSVGKNGKGKLENFELLLDKQKTK